MGGERSHHRASVLDLVDAEAFRHAELGRRVVHEFSHAAAKVVLLGRTRLFEVGHLPRVAVHRVVRQADVEETRVFFCDERVQIVS